VLIDITNSSPVRDIAFNLHVLLVMGRLLCGDRAASVFDLGVRHIAEGQYCLSGGSKVVSSL
jgi:hypothetical protein